jgi:hypothetical protein
MLPYISGGQRFKHVERQLERSTSASIVKFDVGHGRSQRPRDARNQLGHDRALRVFVARCKALNLIEIPSLTSVSNQYEPG